MSKTSYTTEVHARLDRAIKDSTNIIARDGLNPGLQDSMVNLLEGLDSIAKKAKGTREDVCDGYYDLAKHTIKSILTDLPDLLDSIIIIATSQDHS